MDSLANNHNAELDSLETAHSNQVTALEGDVASLEADVDSLSVLEGDLRIGLDSLYQVNGTQSDSIDTLNNRIEDLDIEIQSKNDSIDTLEAEIVQLKADHTLGIDNLIDSHEAVVAELKAQHQILIAHKDSLIGDYVIQVSDLTTENAELKNDLTVAQNQLVVDSIMISGLQIQVDTLQSKVFALNTELSAVNIQLSDTIIALNSARALITVLESRKESLEQQLSDEKARSFALQSALDSVNLELSAVTYSRDSLVIVVTDLENQLELSESQQTGWVDSVAVLNDRIVLLSDTAAMVDGLYFTIDSLELALEDLQENPALVPIEVDLLQGWNIIGFTLPEPQDMAATFDDIKSEIQIVKNNAGQTYWPEFGFNGIGDIIPGHGYQIRLSNPILNYTFKSVTARMELIPTVPQWVYELEVPMHPNDIRTLDRVINMSGQEVDPSRADVKGKVLLYLYNDGTVEKRWNK